MRTVTMTVALGVGLALVAVWLAYRASPRGDAAPHAEATAPTPLERTLPVRVQPIDSSYVGSDSCRACHRGRYASWSRTYHSRMTRVANERTVIPPWEGEIRHRGRLYRLFRRGEELWVDMPALDTRGDRESDRDLRRVVMTTGSHHLQLYWTAFRLGEPGDAGGIVRPRRRATARERAAYQARCSACHGSDGEGVDGAEPSSSAEGPALAGRGLPGRDVVAALESPVHDDLTRVLGRTGLSDAVQAVIATQHLAPLMQFPFVYLIEEARWVHEEDTFLAPAKAPPRGEPYQEGWSDGCALCHSLMPRFEPAGLARPARSRVAELGITCESCHGPGAEHVALRQGGKRPGADDPIVVPRRLDHRRSAAVCGQCHAELVARSDEPLVARFRPGDLLEQYAHVVQPRPPPHPGWLRDLLADQPRLLDDAFWEDGTIRIAGRDYNGIVRSACYVEGEMSCTSCHQLHGADPNDQLRARARGNGACLGCHDDLASDVSAHTHHAPESPGSLCYNCHMPRTTVGLLTVMRAHRITSPAGPDGGATDRPHACALCHVDRPLAQLRARVGEWYDELPAPSDASPSNAPSTAAVATWLLSGDAVQRAVAAWHLGWGPAREASGEHWQAPLLARALDDPYAAVRYLAGRSLARLPAMQDVAYDHVGSVVARARASRSAMRAWQRSGQGRAVPPHRRRAVLLEASGQDLDRARVSALERERDDAPVAIDE